MSRFVRTPFEAETLNIRTGLPSPVAIYYLGLSNNNLFVNCHSFPFNTFTYDKWLTENVCVQTLEAMQEREKCTVVQWGAHTEFGHSNSLKSATCATEASENRGCKQPLLASPRCSVTYSRSTMMKVQRTTHGEADFSFLSEELRVVAAWPCSLF